MTEAHFPDLRAPDGARDLRRDAEVGPASAITRSRLSRRAFTTGLAASGLVILGRPAVARAGDLADPDAVKQYLTDVKNAVCAVAERVDGLKGPLTDPDDIAFVTVKIESAAATGQSLLNTPTSLLWAPASVWLYWPSPEVLELNLTETATLTCYRACEALEEYCAQYPNGPFEVASELLWRTHRLYCQLFDTAGIG